MMKTPHMGVFIIKNPYMVGGDYPNVLFGQPHKPTYAFLSRIDVKVVEIESRDAARSLKAAQPALHFRARYPSLLQFLITPIQ
jgi:hypothetical protein